MTRSKERLNHTAIGSAFFLADPERWRCLPDMVKFIVSSVSAGHHGGLRNWKTRDEIVEYRRTLVEIQEQGQREFYKADLAYAPPPLAWNGLSRYNPPMLLTDRSRNDVRVAIETVTRFHLSALTAADAECAIKSRSGVVSAWLDKKFPSMQTLAASYEQGLARLLKDKNPRTKINRLCRIVSEAALEAAAGKPGFYSITASTGLGKTMAAMRFALHHAVANNLRHVFYTAPFTSIIEQNTEAYRKWIGHPESITEHHSNVDAKDDSTYNKMMASFWLAPIICTSNLQLIESLFSNRVGRVRKIHNVIKSVIIIDEAQELPPRFLTPIVDMLRRLVENYGCTVVFTTATQPALEQITINKGIDNITEIVPNPDLLMQKAKRVRFVWPKNHEDRWSWDKLVAKLVRHKQVITTVYKRADALEVYNRLPEEGRYCLTALKCPAHRTVMLEEIKARLESGQIVRLVCTRLVKAGVDVDFPTAYESLVGPDDGRQTGGRVNRYGLRPRQRSLVYLFYPAESKPINGLPRQAHSLLQQMLAENKQATGRYRLDLDAPATFKQYFAELYDRVNTDRDEIQRDRSELNFVTVGRKMRFIKDDYLTMVVVPYRDGVDVINQLIAKGASDAMLLRKMQRYVVQIYRKDHDAMAGLLREIHPDLAGVYYLDFEAADQFYRDDVGLCTPEGLVTLLGLDDFVEDSAETL